MLTIRRHNALTVSDDVTATCSKTSWKVYRSDCQGQAQDELRFQEEISRDQDAGNGRVDRMSTKGKTAQDEQVFFRAETHQPERYRMLQRYQDDTNRDRGRYWM